MEIKNKKLISITEEDIENGTIIIPKEIEIIGKYSIAATTIKELILPNNIKKIGTGAFFNCENLERIILSDKLKKISSGAFYGCKNLQEITFYENIQEIETNAFDKCESLKIIKTTYGNYKEKKNIIENPTLIYLYLYSNYINKNKYKNISCFLKNKNISSLFEDEYIHMDKGILKFKKLYAELGITYDIPKELFDILSLEKINYLTKENWEDIKLSIKDTNVNQKIKIKR